MTPALAVTWKDSPYIEINTLYPFSGGLILLSSYADSSVSSCDSGKRFAIHKDDSNYQVKASMLMAAFMAGKKVKLRYDARQAKACEAKVDRFLVIK